MTEIIFRSDMKVHLVKTNASDLDTARAAWVSLQGADAREKDSDHVEGLIDFLWRNEHTSPFEHGAFTFMVECPIFVARQWQRHRTQSYNEWSLRYSTFKGEFYVPPAQKPLVQEGKFGSYQYEIGSSKLHEHFDSLCFATYKRAWESYNDALDMGIAQETARILLPVGSYTYFYATANTLNVLRWLKGRIAADAQWEIRNCAEQVARYVEETVPATYEAWKRHTCPTQMEES